jgi:hypothetical protein
MPYAKKTQKPRTRKRTYRRKPRYRKNLVLSKAPIPNKFGAKLRYVDSISVNPGAAGVAGVHVFRATSCYDPDYTSVGHQPRGFDQWMNMFYHFTVIGAKITCEFALTGQTDDRAVVCGVNLKDSATTYSDKNNYTEGRNCRTKLLSGGAAGDARSCTLTMTYSPKKFLGQAHPLEGANLKGSATANPTEDSCFHVWAAPTGSADLETIAVHVRIDYLVIFTEPVQPSQS